jgi:hypothetical protein
MPNPRPKQPNPSLKEKTLRKHFAELGIDYDIFGRLIEAKASIATLRRFYRKPDGKLRTQKTMNDWVEQYKAEHA